MRLTNPTVAGRMTAATLLLSLISFGSAASASNAAAAPTLQTLTITGHGYGHGRGLGQYGAYGYALQGWSAPQILAHYYGGTSMVAVDPTQAVTVALSEFDAAAVIAPAADGTQSLSEHGVTRYYLGTLTLSGAQWSNTLQLDQYVAGVVPAESPSSWGVSGIAALEAQAVAARSYALAVIQASPAGTICDTAFCQVYDGDPDVAGSVTNGAYVVYSNEAVQASSGEVLVCVSATCGNPGAVALTEFSSSTGGYSAGGRFPAVVDAGDGWPGAYNPNHTWTQTVSAATVDAAYPAIGLLESVAVTARNGLGDMGGRVSDLVLTGTAGSVTTTGYGFSSALGLRSDWFSFSGSSGASGGDDGYWIVATDGSVSSFGAAPSYGSMAGQPLNGPIVAMAPTADQSGYWLVGSDGGIFSFGDARFHGSTGSLRLNRPVLGMAATPDGGGYWLVASDGGIFSFGDARFYGSTGSLHLNRPIVGMAATPDGGGYWLVASDGGIFAFGDAHFYGSTGSLALNRPVVGMVPTADGRGYTLVAADGGVFAFGDAGFAGSLPGLGVTASVAGVSPTADGGGYLVATTDGRVYAFGDAPDYGGMSNLVAGWSGTALGIFARRGP